MGIVQEVKSELVKLKDPIIFAVHLIAIMYVLFGGTILGIEVKGAWMIGLLLISAYVSLTKDTTYPTKFGEVETNGGHIGLGVREPGSGTRAPGTSGFGVVVGEQEVEGAQTAQTKRRRADGKGR